MKTTTTLLPLLLTACAGAPGWVPARAGLPPPDEVALVWVGRGECERFEDGRWVRRPEYDYEFSVEQHRRGDAWESVKSLRRLHPDYDGAAGPRTQTYYFAIDLGTPSEDGAVALAIHSTLGAGHGSSDREFRDAVLEIAADVSSLAPFDRYRITQRYGYAEGQLEELVELNDGTTPWVRNREVATLFAASHFDAPPTRR